MLGLDRWEPTVQDKKLDGWLSQQQVSSQPGSSAQQVQRIGNPALSAFWGGEFRMLQPVQLIKMSSMPRHP
jgi:hypothetical protein